MEIKNKLLYILICFAVIGAGYYFLFYKPDPAGNTVADNTFGWKFPVVEFPITGKDDLAYSSIRTPGIPQGLPVRLKIPIIGVNSAIEDALITADGRMDVPEGSVNVAWFALGPHPGKIGSAVIGGHFGIRNGVKFVFYDLDKLRVGDKIYIENDEGKTLAFQVRAIKLFDRNADATTVFTSKDGLAHLNLITCEGIWNKVNDTYPERRVVFTDAIPSEGEAPDSITFKQTLRIGARGNDVMTLQNVLNQKKSFGILAGIVDGVFGKLTRAAVATYQTSVGLQADGVFGPLTRAKIISGETFTPIFPITAFGDDSDFSKTFSQSVKSLYATPLDGLITSALIISIIFILFKIIAL